MAKTSSPVAPTTKPKPTKAKADAKPEIGRAHV